MVGYRNPCAAPSGAGASGPSADELAAAIVARLMETELRVAQPTIKGQTITALANAAAAGVSNPIPMDKYNAAYVQVLVSGTSPTGTITIEGLGGGDFQTLGDSNASKAIIANTAYEVVVGAPEIRVRLANVTGTAPTFTVFITPFVSPGSTNLNIAAASSVELAAGSATVGGTTDAGFATTTAHKRVNSANATAGIDITDAPTSGQKRVLVDLVISTDTAMNVVIEEETSGTDFHGPYYLPANGSMQITTRATPMSKLATADKKYRAIASAAGNLTIETWSYSEA